MNGLKLFIRFLPIWMTVLVFETPIAISAEEAPNPPRVARISAIEGSASIWTDEEKEWQAIDVNAPVLAGDRVYAALGSRVEIQLGDDVFVRLDKETYITLPFLEENFIRIEVQQGSVNVNARETEYDRPPVEVLASTFLATIEEPVNARFDVQPTGAEISVQRGRLNVNIDKERFIRVERGEKLIAPTADPDTYTKMPIGPADSFDAWTDVRDAITATLPGEPKVSNRISGHSDLDRYGEWVDVPTYGTVWRPRAVANDWAPYREGYWTWRYRYGWVWVSYEPWGWAPYHYGRWVYVDRYNWVWTPHYAAYVGPSYHYRRPYWYPALVSFTYADRGDYFRFSIGGGHRYYNDCVGWFPLGYHDPYYWNWGYYHNHHRHHYYYDDYHRGFHRRGGNTFINNGTIVINDYDYDNSHVTNAVTVMPRKDFTASIYDRKTAATVQTSARRAIAMGASAMNDLPDVNTVRIETQKTKLAMRDSNQPLTSPSRIDSEDSRFASSSKPRSITTNDEKPVAMTTTKPARLRDAETPRMTMSNPAVDEKRIKVAQRSKVDVKSIRQAPAVAETRSGQSVDRSGPTNSRLTSPSRTTSPGRNTSTVAPNTRSRLSTPSVSTPAERSGRSLSQPSSPSRVGQPVDRTESPNRSTSPSRVGQPQERSTQQAPSTIRERSSRAQELRSRSTTTTPNSQAARNRQGLTEPSMSMNWSEAARNRSYQINSRSRFYDTASESRAITPPVRVQSPANSGSMSTTRRTYNLDNQGAYSVSPRRTEPEQNVRVYNRSGTSYETNPGNSPTRRSEVQIYTPDSSPRRSYSAPSVSPSRSSSRSYESSPFRSSNSRSYDVSPSRSSSSRSTTISPSRSSQPSPRLSSPSTSRSQSGRSVSPSRSSSSSSRLSSPSVSNAQSSRMSSPSRSSVGTSRASQMRSTSPSRSSAPSSAASRARRP